MKAINYCHKNKICHRDLKPENFLFLSKKEESPLKVIDFGISKVFGNDVWHINEEVEKMCKKKISKGRRRKRGNFNMNTKAGTPYYIAPEVISGDYDESCDIWAAGVILYIMMCGYPPFYGESDNDILWCVKQGKYDFSGEEWEFVNHHAIDLISKMIAPQDRRISS